jgi:hypothetical protein
LRVREDRIAIKHRVGDGEEGGRLEGLKLKFKGDMALR